MAPNSPACLFIHLSMAGSRSTAPLNRNKSVFIVTLLFSRSASDSPLIKMPGRVQNTGRPSVGMPGRGIVVRPERRQVSAEVQFEVAANAVTNITNLRTASLRAWQGQQREEQVVARLQFGSGR